jgi:hypothetical protein
MAPSFSPWWVRKRMDFLKLGSRSVGRATRRDPVRFPEIWFRVSTLPTPRHNLLNDQQDPGDSPSPVLKAKKLKKSLAPMGGFRFY